jgi:uncharacterized FlgJ-related protein
MPEKYSGIFVIISQFFHSLNTEPAYRDIRQHQRTISNSRKIRTDYAMQYNSGSYSLGSSLFQRMFNPLGETRQHTWPSGRGAFDQCVKRFLFRFF